MPININKAAEEVLRGYLERCFSEVSKQYPEVSSMSAKEGAETLIKLKNENKINIKLRTVAGNLIKCTIERIN